MKPGSGTPHEGGRRGDFGGAGAGLLDLVGLDLFGAVQDAAADLDVARPVAEPAPALKGAWADAPATGQIGLIQVSDGHRALQQGVSKTCEEDAGCRGRSPGGQKGAGGEELLLSETHAIYLTERLPKDSPNDWNCR